MPEETWSHQGERTWGLFLGHEIYSKMDTEMWGARQAEEISFLQKQDGYSMGSKQDTPFTSYKQDFKEISNEVGSFVLPLDL